MSSLILYTPPSQFGDLQEFPDGTPLPVWVDDLEAGAIHLKMEINGILVADESQSVRIWDFHRTSNIAHPEIFPFDNLTIILESDFRGNELYRGNYQFQQGFPIGEMTFEAAGIVGFYGDEWEAFLFLGSEGNVDAEPLTTRFIFGTGMTASSSSALVGMIGAQ